MQGNQFHIRNPGRRRKLVNAAETYIAMIDAASAQRARIHEAPASAERWSNETSARRFRFDPHRSLNSNMEIIASFLKPTDVLLDVGGGAGRIGLPLALRCQELINVDPAAAMLKQFEECATEAGITNARSIRGDWLEVDHISGDVVLSTHVTYFVRKIVSFIEKLQAAARRRVIIDVNSVASSNRTDKLFRLVYGEEQVTVPAHRELLAVIWEMGILPDVKVLPLPSMVDPPPESKKAAIEQALEGSWVVSGDRERAAMVLESHFGELFATEDGAIRPLWRPHSQEILITWETEQRG